MALGIVILLFSVILHEVMHGFVALKFGDRTAELAGRLTLNPLPHIDPVGTILVPAILILPAVLAGVSPSFVFGWAKPVPVNPFNFRDIKKGELFTSGAGVAANFGLAVIAALIFHLLPATISPLLPGLLSFVVQINLLLGLFNLLPLPPLDGSKILMTFLPPKLAAQYQAIERYGLFILILLWFIPLGNTTILGFVLGTSLGLLHSLLGV